MSFALHVVRAGEGPQILLIHGSAADHRTWSIQLASSLRSRFSLVAYDRRGDARTIEEHADDAAALLPPAPGRSVVIGSSFGAVVALELIRRRPGPVAGAILIEPPLGASDTEPAVRSAFLDHFDRTAAERGGPAAGELFLRAVLGDPAFERMPRTFQRAAAMKHAEIRADSVALLAYRPRYAELAQVAAPVLLLGGERSAPRFRPTLEALHRTLPGARLEIVPAAGHMLHAEASRRFHALISEFAGQVLGELAPG